MVRVEVSVVLQNCPERAFVVQRQKICITLVTPQCNYLEKEKLYEENASHGSNEPCPITTWKKRSYISTEFYEGVEGIMGSPDEATAPSFLVPAIPLPVRTLPFQRIRTPLLLVPENPIPVLYIPPGVPT